MLSGLAGDGFIFVFWPPVFLTFLFCFVLAILVRGLYLAGDLCVIDCIISITSYGRQKSDHTGDYGNPILGLAEPLMELLNKLCPALPLVPEPAG